MAKSIRKLAVVGAGTMGAAIAACGARGGLDVVLMVRGKAEESGSERAQKAVAAILKTGEMKIEKARKWVRDSAFGPVVIQYLLKHLDYLFEPVLVPLVLDYQHYEVAF